MSAGELFTEGKLREAIPAALDEVKKAPMEPGLRWRLCELLCFAGELERADKQLEAVLSQFPKLATNAILFRQLIRAETARQQLWTDGRLPEFPYQPSDAVERSLEATVHIRAGDHAKAAELVQQAEDSRPRLSGNADAKPFDDFRDLDDILSPVLEVLTGDGKYLWVGFDQVRSLKFTAPERSRDLLWRAAELRATGLSAHVHIPALYPLTHRETDDALRLGRSTDWRGAENEPVRGVGQRMWLVGSEHCSIMDVKELHFDATE